MSITNRVIIRLLSVVDALLMLVTFGQLQTQFKNKFLQEKLDQLLQKELEAANSVIDRLNEK